MTGAQFKSANVLVLGIGAYAYGRAKRAVRVLDHMSQVSPYFLTTKYGDGSVDRLLDKHGYEYERVPFGYLGLAKPTWTIVTLTQIPRLYYKLLSAYFRNRCDTLLLLQIHPLINAFFPLLLLKILCKNNMVLYLGDIPTNHAVHRLVARIINLLTDRIIANSNTVAEGLVELGIQRDIIRVVYNGVDLRQFTDVTPRPFRHIFGWPSQSVLIGYVGQFTEQKGVWDFAKAAELVLQSDKNCRFLMVGEVDQQNQFQHEISHYIGLKGLKKHVVFTGWIDDIEAAYAALDILIVPSRYEDPAPNVNIEAMASGVPVVATRVGGTPELVIDGKTGFLVEKNNPEEIAQRVLQLVRNQELRKKMGCAGKERVYQMFNVRKNASLVEEILLNG